MDLQMSKAVKIENIVHFFNKVCSRLVNSQPLIIPEAGEGVQV
jgi:hypothetical protein